MANYVLALKKDKTFLRDRCDEVKLNIVEKPRVVGIINDIKDTLKADKRLVALNANQLGHKERIFCIKFSNGDIRAFINPVIAKTDGTHLSREVSIGLDDKEYIVPRATNIIATYQTPDMVDTCDMNKFSGAVAEVFQQMNHLLDGILLEDIGLEILPGFDEASEEERQEIIAMYLESLENRKAMLEKEIESNPDAKDMDKAIKFIKELQEGKIETIPLTEEEKEKIREAELKELEEKKVDDSSI